MKDSMISHFGTLSHVFNCGPHTAKLLADVSCSVRRGTALPAQLNIQMRPPLFCFYFLTHAVDLL